MHLMFKGFYYNGAKTSVTNNCIGQQYCNEAMDKRQKAKKKKREKRVTFAAQCWSNAKVSAHICCLSTPIKDAQTKMHFNIATNSLPARNAVFPAETPDKTQIPPSPQRWSDVK